MPDPFGVFNVASSATTGSPLVVTLTIPASFHAVVTVTNEHNSGPVLAKASGDSAWAVVPPGKTFGLSIPSAETLQLAVVAPQYRSLDAVGTPREVPYKTTVQLKQLVAV